MYMTALMPGIISALLLPIMSSCIKIALNYFPIEVLLNSRYLISAIIFVIPYLIFGRWSILKTKLLHWHFLRAVTGCMSLACMLYALNSIPLINTVLLSNLTPIYLLIILMFKGEIMPSFKIITLIISCSTGFIYLFSPDYIEFNSGYIAGLGIGLFTALSILILQKLKEESVTTSLSYYYIISSILLAIWLGVIDSDILLRDQQYTFTTILWFSLALFFSIAYQYSLTYALKIITAREMAPLFFLSIVVSFVIDHIFWGNAIGAVELIIIVMISICSIQCSRELYQTDKASG